jgi:hypothetical protein
MATRILTLIAFLIAVALRSPARHFGAGGRSSPPRSTRSAPAASPTATKAMDVLVATGDERVPPVLQALSDGNLYIRESDGKVVIATKAADSLAADRPGRPAGRSRRTAEPATLEKIKTNNGLRGAHAHRHRQADAVEPERSRPASAPPRACCKNADPGHAGTARPGDRRRNRPRHQVHHGARPLGDRAEDRRFGRRQARRDRPGRGAEQPRRDRPCCATRSPTAPDGAEAHHRRPASTPSDVRSQYGISARTCSTASR